MRAKSRPDSGRFLCFHNETKTGKEGKIKMKRKLLALCMLALSLTACTPKQAEPEIVYVRTTETETESDSYKIDFPNLRTAEGIYHDYMTVETTDGNLWNMGEDSRYFENGNVIFTEGEKVVVLFDMWGETIEDDIILDVHSLEY